MAESCIDLEFSDCVLICTNVDTGLTETYKLHKYTLATKSKYFYNLFKFKNTTNYVLNLPFEFATLQTIFNTIYSTELVETVQQNNLDILAALNYFLMDDYFIKIFSAKLLSNMLDENGKPFKNNNELKNFSAFAKNNNLSIILPLDLMVMYYDCYKFPFIGQANNFNFCLSKDVDTTRGLSLHNNFTMVGICLSKKAKCVSCRVDVSTITNFKLKIKIWITNGIINDTFTSKDTEGRECNLECSLKNKYKSRVWCGVITIIISN